VENGYSYWPRTSRNDLDIGGVEEPIFEKGFGDRKNKNTCKLLDQNIFI